MAGASILHSNCLRYIPTKPITGSVTVDDLVKLPEPHCPHLQTRDNSHTSLMKSLWQVSEIINAKLLEQFLSQKNCSVILVVMISEPPTVLP